jgi:hypothetical protein
MDKYVWLSILEKDEAKGKELFESVLRYGLKANGHFWSDDLDKMEWAGPLPELAKPEIAAWLIRGSAASLADEKVRYGLSLLAVAVHAVRGYGFPVLILQDGAPLDPASLPTPLRGAEVVPSPALLGAKLVAKASAPQPKIAPEYRLDIHALPGLGQWFEVGPAAGRAWDGVMFGVAGGEIDAHGVGPKGKLPEKSTLEYPMKGLKFTLGETEFTGNAVRNALDENTSYFLRVRGVPSALAFGSFSQGDDAEVFVATLK